MNDKTLHIIFYINTIIFTIAAILSIKMYEIKTLENNKKIDYQKENIVLLGDSITEWYPIDRMFDKKIPIINSGLAGKKSHEILEKLPELVYQYNPTKVFILVGTNDLNVEDEEKDLNQTINNIIQMVKNIKENRKYAEIFVQSIYPVNKEIDVKGGHRTNEEIKTINEALENYCLETNTCSFIDLYTKLIDKNNNLNEKYTVDSLHISEEGYKLITKVLLSSIRGTK